MHDKRATDSSYLEAGLTLNITYAAPQVVIQASDRRMVSIPSGRLISDEANKGVVLEAEDGIFAITFAGIGVVNHKRVDHWLAEQLAESGVPELPISQGLETLARLVTQWFKTFPPAVNKRHVFVVAGYERSIAGTRAAVWTLTNYSKDGWSARAVAEDAFTLRRVPIGGQRGLFLATGIAEAMHREDRRRFAAKLRATPSVEALEESLVSLVRDAAGRPASANGINRNVLTIATDPPGHVRTTYHPLGNRSFNYAPLCVWHQGDKNVIAGDARMTNSPHWGCQFGRAMLVGPVSENPARRAPKPDVQRAGFLFRFSEARFKREPAENINLFGFVPITPEALEQLKRIEGASIVDMTKEVAT
jgi:hypothetical protein